MAIKEKAEKLYRVLDDTINVGKEPFPIFTESVKAFHKETLALKKKYMKSKKLFLIL